ncbi:STAS domain-containing protein [Hankyongella ginsenosidimutans]|uniref:STAS domain-containing protein n=1 Tax=Hankyongella ginsenosidimutans TaxID=1763828 RepID=UPI001CA36CEA
MRLEPQPGGGATYRFAGDLTVASAADVEAALESMERHSPATFELGDVTSMDTAGAWLLYRTQQKWRADGIEVSQSGRGAIMPPCCSRSAGSTGRATTGARRLRLCSAGRPYRPGDCRHRTEFRSVP